jgi:hypothetical protein
MGSDATGGPTTIFWSAFALSMIAEGLPELVSSGPL